ncbi:general stress protein [Lacicoccus alkaliphilus]|uniref:Heat induced stress protein YflT n=1 Tax=Lacicoccus alkaliphilus DSM 16010 TaxID=1123231 RepID=A0A1M7KKH3_9BACL|nr:general stress protein [Salinicoccus alkaliphilus]SHM65897.1 Heat induced stress protein YflT [Salinicoccus alkaliphilus DSM 16010]
MSRFEKLASEKDVVERLEQLQEEGVRDDEITVISGQKLEFAYLKFRDVNFKDAEGTTWDKFTSMFSDADPKDKVLADFDITESEKEHFKDALDRDEILLLKEPYGVQEEGHAGNETRDFHETQQQDAQGLESKAARDERMDAQSDIPRRQRDPSYDYPSSRGRAVEQDDDVTLKDTADDREYGYGARADEQKKRPSDRHHLDDSEYGYTKRPDETYGYK